jgi:plastocyanin
MCRSLSLRPAVFGAALLLLAAAPASAKVIQIEITKLAFVPEHVTAEVGDTIEWRNADFVDHTATETGEAWDVMIPKDGSGSLLIESPGTVEYFCRFHPNMRGSIEVTAP